MIDMSYPLTFTNFIIKNFTLGDGDEYNAIFERFFTSNNNDIWSIAILNEYESGLITKNEFNIIMFIASLYNNRMLLNIKNDILEIEISYKCSRFEEIMKYVFKSNYDERNIYKIFVEYIRLMKEIGKVKNDVIPDDIFEKVMRTHVYNIFKLAVYIIITKDVAKSFEKMNTKNMFNKNILPNIKCYDFSYDDVISLRDMGYNFDCSDEERHNLIVRKILCNFSVEKLYSVFKFISDMLKDINIDNIDQNLAITKINTDIKFLNYIKDEL